jgi:hypothetical protein
VRSSTSSGLAMHEHTLMLFLVVLAFTYAFRRHALNMRRRVEHERVGLAAHA